MLQPSHRRRVTDWRAHNETAAIAAWAAAADASAKAFACRRAGDTEGARVYGRRAEDAAGRAAFARALATTHLEGGNRR